MLCSAFVVSFGVPVVIARSSNNFGRFQYPEKLIPRFVSLAMQNRHLPLYGDGRYIRDWLHVEDNCRALMLLLRKGEPGEIYNIGASELHENIEITKLVLSILDKPSNLISNVEDRLGHDRRYCVDWRKIEKLGWRPKSDFNEEFRKTIIWYRDRSEWRKNRSREAEDFYNSAT